MVLIKRRVPGPADLVHFTRNEQPALALRDTAQHHLEGIIDQLVALFAHSHHMFTELLAETEACNNRIVSLRERVSSTMLLLPSTEQLIGESPNPDDFVGSERLGWKQAKGEQHQRFAKSTNSGAIEVLYAMCQQPPPLGMLDPYREGEAPCLRLYTNPNFFLEQWIETQQRELAEEKERRRKRREERKAKKAAKKKATQAPEQVKTVTVRRYDPDTGELIVEQQPAPASYAPQQQQPAQQQPAAAPRQDFGPTSGAPPPPSGGGYGGPPSLGMSSGPPPLGGTTAPGPPPPPGQHGDPMAPPPPPPPTSYQDPYAAPPPPPPSATPGYAAPPPPPPDMSMGMAPPPPPMGGGIAPPPPPPDMSFGSAPPPPPPGGVPQPPPNMHAAPPAPEPGSLAAQLQAAQLKAAAADTPSSGGGGGGGTLLSQIQGGVALRKVEAAPPPVNFAEEDTGFNTDLISKVLGARRAAMEDSDSDDSDSSDWD